jgi:putative DNA-invertase from lambdoid prophage Rac
MPPSGRLQIGTVAGFKLECVAGFIGIRTGFDVDENNVIKDEGVSGISTCLAERDGGKRLLDKLRAGDVLVVRWLDRLGRHYDDVRDTVQVLMRKGVIVWTVINNFTFDGSQTDPIQRSIRDALLAFMSAIGQAQSEATELAQQAGIAHAQAIERVYLGRKPSYSREQLARVLDLLATASDITVAKQVGLDRLAIRRIRQDPAKAEAALASWEVRPRRKKADHDACGDSPPARPPSQSQDWRRP